MPIIKFKGGHLERGTMFKESVGSAETRLMLRKGLLVPLRRGCLEIENMKILRRRCLMFTVCSCPRIFVFPWRRLFI